MTRRTIRTATTASALALAASLAATPAAAQSFQGSSTVTFGSATVTQGSGTTDVTVNSGSAVIDWTPDDMAANAGVPIVFQNTGTTATYSGAADYAVLNRIVPTDVSRPIVFDGTVLSRVAGLAGGTVFFYSPGGIILGANAAFDIGNLGLTTAAPVVDVNGLWYTGNQVQFQQANSASSINITPGAQITASAENSYVAAFAPFVQQSGTIDVNGQAALVAAEAGSITFSPDGLFNIQVSIGTDGQSGTGILHDGTTTGPASSGAGDNHRIYMVAVPKNQLLTLAIARGSEIGFDIAGAADTVGNMVLLSAGRNVSNGFSPSVQVGGALAQIQINDSGTGSTAPGIEFTSATRASGSGEVKLDVFNQTNFASNIQLSSSTRSFAAVGNVGGVGGVLTVGGNLALTNPSNEGAESLLAVTDGASASVTGNVFVASQAFSDNNADGAITGGNATVSVDGGTLDISGFLTVDAAANRGTFAAALPVVGGNASVQFRNGASVTLGSDVSVIATATGAGDGTNPAPSATGGLAELQIGGVGTVVSNTDTISIIASGTGESSQVAGVAGAGTGGTAQIVFSGGGSLSAGDIEVAANGTGGFGSVAGSSGGVGQGGTAQIIALNGGTASLTSPFTLVIATGGGGGTSAGAGDGGAGTGGVSQVSAFSGSNLTINGDVQTYTDSFGGSSVGGRGGDATIGRSEVLAIDASLTVNGNVVIDPIGSGGSGIIGGDAIGSTDSLVLGNAFLFARNGSVTISGEARVATILSGGDGLAGGAGGSAVGGTAGVLAVTGPTGGSVIQLGSLDIFSDVLGGNGGSGTTDLDGLFTGAGGQGGNATGGDAFAFGDAGNGQLVVLGAVTAESFAQGGAGGDGTVGGAGGSAIGGDLTIGTRSGDATADNTGSASFGSASLTASGTGGLGGAGSTGAGGDGGDGTNGTALLLVRGTPVTFGGPLDLVASAAGGDGGIGATVNGNGGNAIVGDGGGARIVASSRFQTPGDRGSLSADTVSLVVSGDAGDGATPGAVVVGNQAALIQVDGADLDLGSLAVNVSGDQVAATLPDQFTFANSNSTIDAVTFVTPNDLVFDLDDATLAVDSFFSASRNVVLAAEEPLVAGTLVVASSAFFQVEQDLLTYANLTFPTGAGFSVPGSFQSGNIIANGDLSISATNGSVATGSLTATSLDILAAGDVDVANFTGGEVTTGGDIAIQSLGGSVEVGDLSGSNIELLAAESIDGANISANSSLSVESGGVVFVGGVWSAPTVRVVSGDIDIDADEGEAIEADSLQLVSNNISGMFVGGPRADDGSGYFLDNTEFGTLSAREIFILARDVQSSQSSLGTVDMTIGDLSISGNQIGPDGIVVFATGDVDTLTASGRIRVDGEITGTNMGFNNSIELYSGSIEVNAATGGIRSYSGGVPSNPASPGAAALGGYVVLEADNIHVASQDILLQLRADPFYAGHANDLNQPSGINRPEGVLTALGIEFFPSETLFIQNTGTAANPAGFYATIDESDIEPPGFEDPEAPDVEVIINGRFATESGDITGQEAFQAILDNAESIDGFTATSQVNGCAFEGGGCGLFVGPEESPPPTNTAEIEVLTEDQSEEEPFDSEEEEDDAEQAASSPIAPPVVLINTRPLNPDVDVTDPVSGTGNPALIGASISQTAQGDQ